MVEVEDRLESQNELFKVTGWFGLLGFMAYQPL